MDKVVVITGAADGLGKAFATRFATEGYQVVAADINDEAGESLTVALEAEEARWSTDTVTSPKRNRF